VQVGERIPQTGDPGADLEPQGLHDSDH
jgi:hypothetical protein